MDRLLLSLIVLVSLVGIVHGSCPNSCSGHGSCNQWDICTCYNHWEGYDCSSRVCPLDEAWFIPSPATATVAANHLLATCSNRGTCDSKTGTCKCHDGFTGTACMRSECANDCSGHGICRNLKDNNAAYTGWDKEKIQGCLCDTTGGSGNGYEGPDCSLVRCPENDDDFTGTQSAFQGFPDFQQPANVEVAYCSNRGNCDFSTGLCDCYSGFTGVVCETRTPVAFAHNAY